MRPDAIPIQPVRSYVVLTSPMIGIVFGAAYQLRGTERLEILQRSNPLGMANVVHGETHALFMDATDRSKLFGGRLRVRGPKGILPAPEVQPVSAVMELPLGLMAAWNLMVGERTTVALGNLAVRVAVEQGVVPRVRVDRSLVFAGGLDSDSTARWAPEIAWQVGLSDAQETSGRPIETKRLITENDVRRARMRREQIIVLEGQIVTPAARSLGEELGVFDEA